MAQKTITAKVLRESFCKTEQEQKKELQKIAEMLDEQMSQEETAELVAGIEDALKRSGADLTSWTRFDRLLWIAREAYRTGFIKATSCNLQAITATCEELLQGVTE